MITSSQNCKNIQENGKIALYLAGFIRSYISVALPMTSGFGGSLNQPFLVMAMLAASARHFLPSIGNDESYLTKALSMNKFQAPSQVPATKPLPSQELLLELLEYNPETGFLFWRERGAHLFSDGNRSAEHKKNSWNKKYAGKEALIADTGNGYKAGTIQSSRFYAHRVIFKILYNQEPLQIDHINHIRCDNRKLNLRASSRSENHKNESMPINNTSGFVGVSWFDREEKWKAQITLNGKTRYLGLFSEKTEAIAARDAANIKHGFHKNHGIDKAGVV